MGHNIIVKTVFRVKINLHTTLLYMFTRVTVARMSDVHLKKNLIYFIPLRVLLIN